jgi:hypothetical protein
MYGSVKLDLGLVFCDDFGLGGFALLSAEVALDLAGTGDGAYGTGRAGN